MHKTKGGEILRLLFYVPAGFSAAASAHAIFSAADGGLAGGHGHTVADGNRHAQLLSHGDRAAGAVVIGDTGDSGRSLAADRHGPHHSGGSQRQSGRHIHTLGPHPAAASHIFLRRPAGEQRLVFVGFVDSQNSSLTSWR